MKTRQRARYIVQTTATLVAVAAWVAGGFPQSATAQQVGASSGGLEEVIVTAQRREQNEQEIGISLSAVTGADLTDLASSTPPTSRRRMPAVVLTQPNGPPPSASPSAAFVQNDFADHRRSPAAIYVDDVYVSQMIGLHSRVRHRPRRRCCADAGNLVGRNAGRACALHLTPATDERAGIWT